MKKCFIAVICSEEYRDIDYLNARRLNSLDIWSRSTRVICERKCLVCATHINVNVVKINL
jgi:hypothetical protein